MGTTACASIDTEASLFVPDEARPELRAYLLRCLPRTAGNQLVAPPLRAWILHTSLTFEVEALVADLPMPRNGRGLAEITRALAHEGASWAASGTAPSYQHRRLVQGGFSAVSHAVNSTLYATAIAAAAGIEDHDVVHGITVAALFADIALQEPDEATRIERALSIMRRCGVPSAGGIAGVLARYAHWDGSGTPHLGGLAIPVEGRCAAIACDYDLVTEGGPDGEPHSPRQALAIMAAHDGRYDPDLLLRLREMVDRMAGD